MKHRYHSNNRSINLFTLISVKPSQLVLAATIMSFAGTSIAAWKGDADTAEYVDSVTKWGAWELDIEPAAGGLQQSSNPVINARESKVTLRTNSIAALAPQRPGPPTQTAPVIFSPSPTPIVPPVVPVTPPPPPVTPPIGGPADGLY